ncbi:MAG: SDR family oxidoreductase [Deltaproteobacteria bacterium]|nr:SDR family oxidoreductase [Deltaproteobacteria bacterium]
MKLDQCKLIVTGAASGLGRHFALRLAEAGGQVAAGDVDEAGLAALAQEAQGLAGAVHARRLDVADEASITAFVAFAAGAMGGISGLVNNAGILRDGLLVKKDRTSGEIVKMTRQSWQSVIDVNLTGAVWMVREVAAAMIERGERGAIVNLSSLARHGNRGQSSYVAAKAALAANTRTWALELAPYGIRVAAVAPGMVRTPMTAGMNQKALQSWVDKIPVGRIGEPEDVWLAVRFALECEYFNSRTLDVDGGLSF